MAKKVPAQPVNPAEPETSDLDILHSERYLTLSHRDLIVREYSFVEGLQLRALAKPFADALRDAIAEGETFAFERIEALIGDHYDVVLQLVAISADVDRDFINGLNDNDGNLLLMAWWGACGPFFLRQCLRQLQMAQQELAAVQLASKAVSPGPSSTPASSPTATSPAMSQDKSAIIPGDSFSSGTPRASAANASNGASESST